ncbi:hypothetical protein ACFL6C_13905 [Myxococcota bacterium]
MMASLVFAGEIIYMLPYSLRRDFQTTMVAQMDLIPSDLGSTHTGSADSADAYGGVWLQFRAVLRTPVVWLNALIILVAYMGFWGTFDISAFAVDAWGRDAVFGATVSASAVWLRPVAAIGVGLIADRVSASRAVIVCFGSLIVTFGVFALAPARTDLLWLLWANTAAISVAVFALRGLYFALLEECQIPLTITGTAVGVISLIGYTPDIFTPLLSGWLLDRYPGHAGHQYFFTILAGAAVVGLAAAIAIHRLASGCRRQPTL